MDIGKAAEIMSTRDAAQSLGVSVRTVQLWVENGCLEAWKTPGGHRRIYRQSVSNMLAARHAREIKVGKFEVLICAQSVSHADPLTVQLKTLGPELRIRTVYNGYEALVQIGEHCPDLLLIDLVEENVSSMQMLDALRSTSFIRSMQIIVVTDLSDQALEKLGGLHPGITRFSRPLATAQMLRLVRVYMDISKQN